MDRWKRTARKKLGRGESQKGESQKREGAGEKVAKHCVFQCFVPLENQKVGSLKRRVRNQMKDSKWLPIVAQSTFGSQKCQS